MLMHLGRDNRINQLEGQRARPLSEGLPGDFPEWVEACQEGFIEAPGRETLTWADPVKVAASDVKVGGYTETPGPQKETAKKNSRCT